MNSLKSGGGCRLDCLPYDILVCILQLPVLSIHNIMVLAEVWPHYHQLVMDVLQYHHLPRLFLQSAMDQEGKRRYHSWFYFHRLDVINRRVTFMVQPTVAKRYISNTFNAARPQLRHISLYHTFHQLPSADLDEKRCSASTCSLSCPETKSSLDVRQDSMGPNLIQSHPLSLKPGFHTLSTKRKKRTKELWQFSYRVSHTNDLGEKTEHMYVSPICLTVSLSTLRSSSIEPPSTNIKSPSWFEKYIKPKLSFL